jgi:uncharacterized oxidoreductase
MREMLLDDGHEVIVLARTAASLGFKERLHLYDCDLADRRALMMCIAKIQIDHPDVAILINNAALQYPVPLTSPHFDRQKMFDEVDINLLAPAMLTQHLIAHAPMQAIVNISSGLAFFPKQQSALYCATKAAIHSFSTSLRYQLEDRNVLVCEAILPLVDTPMTTGRGSGKISARAAAIAILEGVKRGKSEIFIGKARLIPILARIAPSIGRRILRGG